MGVGVVLAVQLDIMFVITVAVLLAVGVGEG